METSLYRAILPQEIAKHFKITKVETILNDTSNREELELYLDELNDLPEGYSKHDYESKGFSTASRIQDFPIRGKAVFLVLRRRRWRHKIDKTEIHNTYKIVSEGARITRELSDFLKGRSR